MGIGIISTDSTPVKPQKSYSSLREWIISNCRFKKDLNPNPVKFKIVRNEYLSPFTLLWVNYPNCVNYEGNKILVFRGDPDFIVNVSFLDPHFAEGKRLIARFVPTEDGWDMARRFCISFGVQGKLNELVSGL